MTASAGSGTEWVCGTHPFWFWWPRIGPSEQHATQILTLLLALSCALHTAFAAGIVARHAGASPAQALMTAAGAAGTIMAIFFAAVSAYH